MRRKSTGQNEQVPPIKQISDFGMRISDFVLGDSVCLKKSISLDKQFRVGSCDFVDRPCFSVQTKTIHETTRTKHELKRLPSHSRLVSEIRIQPSFTCSSSNNPIAITARTYITG